MIEDLRNCFLFKDLSEPHFRRVVQHAMTRKLQVGETLFEQGDQADRFYLLSKGQIKLYRLSPAGSEKVLNIITPGQTFGEALIFLEQPRYPVGAEALQSSEVISIDSRDFSDLLRNSIDTCFLMMGVMSRRLHELLHEIDELSLHSASCRVSAYLLDQLPSQSTTFELPIAKQVLASRLSTQPETLSRILKDLTRRGLIEVKGNHVKVLDLQGLSVAADALPAKRDL